MTLNMFIKEKLDFRHDQIWHWVCLSKEKYDQIWHWICLSKEKLTLDMSKYVFEYVCQKKSWL
jgi:hypothetical protein